MEKVRRCEDNLLKKRNFFFLSRCLSDIEVNGWLRPMVLLVRCCCSIFHQMPSKGKILDKTQQPFHSRAQKNCIRAEIACQKLSELSQKEINRGFFSSMYALHVLRHCHVLYLIYFPYSEHTKCHQMRIAVGVALVVVPGSNQ